MYNVCLIRKDSLYLYLILSIEKVFEMFNIKRHRQLATNPHHGGAFGHFSEKISKLSIRILFVMAISIV